MFKKKPILTSVIPKWCMVKHFFCQNLEEETYCQERHQEPSKIGGMLRNLRRPQGQPKLACLRQIKTEIKEVTLNYRDRHRPLANLCGV